MFCDKKKFKKIYGFNEHLDPSFPSAETRWEFVTGIDLSLWSKTRSKSMVTGDLSKRSTHLCKISKIFQLPSLILIDVKYHVVILSDLVDIMMLTVYLWNQRLCRLYLDSQLERHTANTFFIDLSPDIGRIQIGVRIRCLSKSYSLHDHL